MKWRKKEKAEAVEAVEVKKERRRIGVIKNKIAAEFKSKKFKNGAYSSAIIAVILVAVVFVNLLVGEFDLSVDVSNDSMYTMTDQTKTVLKDVKDEINIYYIVSDGQEITMIQNILKKYPGLSDKVSLINKDPDLYPTFVQKYAGTSTDVASNSVIVENKTTGAYKYIPYSDMIQYTTDYSSYYYTGSAGSTASALDVEGQVTAAIQYVSNEDNTKLYQVTGHGETELTDYATNEFTKLCTTVDTLETRTASEVPEDCDILMINGPATDYTEAEVSFIKDYLTKGGKAVIFINPQATGLTNFNSLLSYYGVAVQEGIVMEGASNAVSSAPYYLFPNIESNEITEGISMNTNPVVIPIAAGLKQVATRDTVTIDAFLTTSDDAYSKQGNEWTTYDKESGDVAGPFDQGVLVTEEYNDVTTQLVVLSTSNLLLDDWMKLENYGNAELINNVISYLGGQDTGLSIPTRSLEETYITTTEANVVTWSVILILVIPVALLATGLLIWYRRRKA